MQNTMNPTCTGTSVFAVAYDNGVVVLTDRVVSYGKTARYMNISRQYRVNDRIIVAFGGDHADFHWLQNVIERQVEELAAYGVEQNPKALHAYLTSLLYYRRGRFDPIWNTLVVAGVQKEKGVDTPFIGIVTQRGVAYPSRHVATGFGAMLLNQLIETEYKKKAEKLTKDEAVEIMKKALEISVYHDCTASNDFEVGTVDAVSGVTLGKQETVIGDWQIAETNCQYQ